MGAGDMVARGRPTTSGATRLWIGLAILCAVAVVNMVLMDTSTLGSDVGPPSFRGAGKQTAQRRGGGLGGDLDDGDDDEGGEGMALFPAISHLLKHKRSVPTGKAQEDKGKRLQEDASLIEKRLEADMARVQSGVNDPEVLESVEKDLVEAAKVKARLELRARHKDVASQASQLLEAASKPVEGGHEHLGGVKGWLAVFRRIFEKGRARGGVGAAALVDVLLTLLDVKDARFLEIAESGAGGVPLTGSPFGFLKEYRMWDGVSVGASRHREEWEMRDPHLRARCRHQPEHTMCSESLTTEGLAPLLASLNVAKSTEVVGSLLGTLDFYLVAAMLRASFTPKLIIVAYNRLFLIQAPRDTYTCAHLASYFLRRPATILPARSPGLTLAVPLAGTSRLTTATQCCPRVPGRGRLIATMAPRPSPGRSVSNQALAGPHQSTDPGPVAPDEEARVHRRWERHDRFLALLRRKQAAPKGRKHAHALVTPLAHTSCEFVPPCHAPRHGSIGTAR